MPAGCSASPDARPGSCFTMIALQPGSFFPSLNDGISKHALSFETPGYYDVLKKEFFLLFSV
jgi:hypothetical protein